jgi:hypothetical protein
MTSTTDVLLPLFLAPLLLLASLAVLAVSCAAVGPVVFITAVISSLSAVAAFPSVFELSFATAVCNVHGIPAIVGYTDVVGVPAAVGFPAGAKGCSVAGDPNCCCRPDLL